VCGITQEEWVGHMKDSLHAAQIGRVSEKDVTVKGRAAHIGVSQGRNYDLGDSVRQVVRVVAGDAVLLGLVPPQDDCAMSW
jgi:hypothetical protein